MHIDEKMYEKEGTSLGLFIEIDIFGDPKPDDLVIKALKETAGSYSPTVSWNEEQQCYHLEAEWDPDPNYGDDLTAILQRLREVVPPELISTHIERPNQPSRTELSFIDIEV